MKSWLQHLQPVALSPMTTVRYSHGTVNRLLAQAIGREYQPGPRSRRLQRGIHGDAIANALNYALKTNLDKLPDNQKAAAKSVRFLQHFYALKHLAASS